MGKKGCAHQHKYEKRVDQKQMDKKMYSVAVPAAINLFTCTVKISAITHGTLHSG